MSGSAHENILPRVVVFCPSFPISRVEAEQVYGLKATILEDEIVSASTPLCRELPLEAQANRDIQARYAVRG